MIGTTRILPTQTHLRETVLKRGQIVLLSMEVTTEVTNVRGSSRLLLLLLLLLLLHVDSLLGGNLVLQSRNLLFDLGNHRHLGVSTGTSALQTVLGDLKLLQERV